MSNRNIEDAKDVIEFTQDVQTMSNGAGFIFLEILGLAILAGFLEKNWIVGLASFLVLGALLAYKPFAIFLLSLLSITWGALGFALGWQGIGRIDAGIVIGLIVLGIFGCLHYYGGHYFIDSSKSNSKKAKATKKTKASKNNTSQEIISLVTYGFNSTQGKDGVVKLTDVKYYNGELKITIDGPKDSVSFNRVFTAIGGAGAVAQKLNTKEIQSISIDYTVSNSLYLVASKVPAELVVDLLNNKITNEEFEKQFGAKDLKIIS